MSYWVTLDRPVRYRGADRQSFSVDGETEEQARETVCELVLNTQSAAIASVQSRPYPGEPRLGYKNGDCPSFCLHPAKCAGRSSCPRNIACSE